jgi:signal transduction histidine kinase
MIKPALAKNKYKGNNDEIKDLAFHFDKMRQNIKYTNTNLHELIYQKTKDLEKAVEELRENEKHLMKVNEKLQFLDKAKNDFLNIAAHELRTPTQAILTCADLLTSHPNKKEVIETIQRNARRLNRLISDVLDVTKIEIQRLTLRKETLTITDLVSSIIAEYKEHTEKLSLTKKIEFYYDFPKEKDLLVYADKVRITQVISNLLDNAIKFIEDEGAIHLTIRAERNEENQYQKDMKEEEEKNNKDQVIISIKDTGIGISKDIFPRLFTKFTTTSITGTGLGLYISKNIVEAHGGRIWAENNTNRKGASFTFTLPLSKRENNNN